MIDCNAYMFGCASCGFKERFKCSKCGGKTCMTKLHVCPAHEISVCFDCCGKCSHFNSETGECFYTSDEIFVRSKYEGKKVKIKYEAVRSSKQIFNRRLIKWRNKNIRFKK